MTDWTPALIDRLTALWDGGTPTAEMGRQIGCSKNAIVGKAHRLGLTPRPSPIHHRQPGDPPRVKQPRAVLAGVPTLAPIAVVVEDRPVIAAVPAPVVQAERVAAMPGHPCEWPMWTRGKPTHVYCGAASAGGPRGSHRARYCERHAMQAYRPARPQEDRVPP